MESTVRRFLCVLIGCSALMQAKSQSDSRLVMADRYFANGDYFTAAGLYGQVLDPASKPKTRSQFPLNIRRNGSGEYGSYTGKTDILFKQAESYRLANYWNAASALYRECFEKDSSRYGAALYWFSVCQERLGNLAAADQGLNQFVSIYGTNHEWYPAALKEKETVQFAKEQMARPDSLLYQVKKINTAFGDKGVYAAAGSGDRFLLTSTMTGATTPLSSPYHNRIFSSALTGEGVLNMEPVLIESLDSSFNQGAASLSADGQRLYFTQWKNEKGQVTSSLCFSQKTPSGWGRPEGLSSVNEQGHNSKQPFCTADGKYLFFASDRTGGAGGFDIWYAPLLADGTTGEPVNAGPVINSQGNELAPFYHLRSGTLVFATDRSPGLGGYDLFSSKGSGTEWKAPENMGYPVNSTRDDSYFFAGENGALLDNAIVSSDRGSECCLGMYQISKKPKNKMITGLVMDCASNEPLAGAGVLMKDAAGRSQEMVTSPEGIYQFAVTDTSRAQLEISKDKYEGKVADISVEHVNESNWQTDTLHNAVLCLEKKFVLSVENVVTLYFDFDKSSLQPRAQDQLDSIYTVLSENPSFKIQVSGYTDGKGSARYNKKLSDRRAKACALYLIQKGIDPARISFESFGSCCPIEMELINGRDNAGGRSMNRRALINIQKE